MPRNQPRVLFPNGLLTFLSTLLAYALSSCSIQYFFLLFSKKAFSSIASCVKKEASYRPTVAHCTSQSFYSRFQTNEMQCKIFVMPEDLFIYIHSIAYSVEQLSPRTHTQIENLWYVKKRSAELQQQLKCNLLHSVSAFNS